MSLIPGVGYKATGYTVYWVKPGGGLAGTTNFNPSAPNPFTGGVVDIAAFKNRYGAYTKSGRYELEDGTICMFPVDAESIGILTRAIELAAKQGGFGEFTGTPATHTLNPTTVEVYDYASTHQDGGRSLMSAMGVGGGAGGSGSGAGGATGPLPGRPRIEKVSSSPGLLTLTWITSQASHFDLNVETEKDDGPGWTHTFEDPKQGNTRQLSFEVPDYIYGPCVVKLRGYRGATTGPWSMSKKIDVKKGEGIDKPVEPTENNPVLSDPWAVEVLAILKTQGYTKEQILEAYNKLP